VAAGIIDHQEGTVSSTLTVIGRSFEFDFGEQAIYRLHFVDDTHLQVTVVADAFYPAGTVNDFATGATYTNITDLASGSFWRLGGRIRAID
jgi:hypothetical protein